MLEDKKKKLQKLQCTQESLETYVSKLESLVDDVTTSIDWLDSSVHTDGETFGDISETLYDKVCRLVGIREEVQIELNELIELSEEKQEEIDDLENEIDDLENEKEEEVSFVGEKEEESEEESEDSCERIDRESIEYEIGRLM